MADKDNSLKRVNRPIDVLLMAVGALIGFAVFMMPGDFFLAKGGPLGEAIGLCIAFVLISPVVYSYGYMLRRYPLAGGSFIFTLIAFRGEHRKEHAFISGWFLTIAYWALLCVNIVGAGLVLRYIFPGVFSGPHLYTIFGWDVYLGEVIISLVLIALFAFINIKGMKASAGFQNAVVIILLVAIIGVVAATFISGPDWNNLNPPYPSSKTGFEAIIAMVAMTPWLYMGFDVIPQSAEEYNFTPRKAIFLMFVSMIVLLIVYILNTLVAATYVPWEDMMAMGNFWNLGWAVEGHLGYPGLLVLGVAMMTGIFSGCNAFFSTSARVMYSMGRVDALPESFGTTNENAVPARAIIFIAIAACVAPFVGRVLIGWIIDMLSLAMAICYGYAALATAKTAKKFGDKFAYVMGILGFIMAIVCGLMLVIPSSPGFLSTEAIVMMVFWTVVGLIMYLINRKNYMASDKIDLLAEEAMVQAEALDEQDAEKHHHSTGAAADGQNG